MRLGLAVRDDPASWDRTLAALLQLQPLVPGPHAWAPRSYHSGGALLPSPVWCVQVATPLALHQEVRGLALPSLA